MVSSCFISLKKFGISAWQKIFLVIVTTTVFLFMVSNTVFCADIQAQGLLKNKSQNTNVTIKPKAIHIVQKFSYGSTEYNNCNICGWDLDNPILLGQNANTSKYEIVEFDIVKKKYKTLIQSDSQITDVKISRTGNKLAYLVLDISNKKIHFYVCNIALPKKITEIKNIIKYNEYYARRYIFELSNNGQYLLICPKNGNDQLTPNYSISIQIIDLITYKSKTITLSDRITRIDKIRITDDGKYFCFSAFGLMPRKGFNDGCNDALAYVEVSNPSSINIVDKLENVNVYYDFEIFQSNIYFYTCGYDSMGNNMIYGWKYEISNKKRSSIATSSSSLWLPFQHYTFINSNLIYYSVQHETTEGKSDLPTNDILSINNSGRILFNLPHINCEYNFCPSGRVCADPYNIFIIDGLN